MSGLIGGQTLKEYNYPKKERENIVSIEIFCYIFHSLVFGNTNIRCKVE